MMIHNDLYSQDSITSVVDALTEMADLALAFGRVDRTGPCHPDGTPESDTDHTVMLGWVAPCLAELINRRMGFSYYDVDRVAVYALVHDAPEVYAGDTCTIRVTEDDLLQKADREGVAAAKLHRQFMNRLPWFARMVIQYEAQQDKHARFVRAVDKVLPKMVHLVDGRVGLRKEGVTPQEFAALVARQREQVVGNIAAGNAFVVRLYDELCKRVQAAWQASDEPTPPPPPQPPRHWLDTSEHRAVLRHQYCPHVMEATCPYSLAVARIRERGVWPPFIVSGPLGRYEVALDERGELIQKEN